MNPSYQDMESADKANGIRSLKNLKVSNQKFEYNDGYHYTEYERTLFYLLNSEEVGLSEQDKANLINEIPNIHYRSTCLNKLDISPDAKYKVLSYMTNEGVATRDEYYNTLYALATNEKSGISAYSMMEIIKQAKQYKLDEVSTEHDTAYNNLVYTVSRDAKSFEEWEKIQLLSSMEDKEFVREFVEHHHEETGLNNWARLEIIYRSNDPEYIEDLLKGKVDIDLGDNWKQRLVDMNGRKIKEEDKKDYYLQYANNQEYQFDSNDRIELIRKSGDKQSAINFLEEHHSSLHQRYQTRLLKMIEDKEYADSYIAKQEEPFKTYLTDEYIRRYGTEEEKNDWNSRITEIFDVSKLSYEDFEKLPENAMIRITGEGFPQEQQQLYSKETYGRIMESINQKFGDIEPAVAGDKESELNTFLEVYNRITEMVYDEYAISKEGEQNQVLQTTCRNLQGGLLENKCVCAGYADILRNVLATKNIDAKFIGGHYEKSEGGHAWNQVKIGDQWFNVDPTWDRNIAIEKKEQGGRLGPEVLKTDEEFSDHGVFSRARSSHEEKCNTRINEFMQTHDIHHETKEQITSNAEIFEKVDEENITGNTIHNVPTTEILITEIPTTEIPTTEIPKHEIEELPEVVPQQNIPIEETIVIPENPIIENVIPQQEVPLQQVPATENYVIPQDMGIQVQNMLDAYGVTTAEFANQAQQIQQMEQMQQLQQMQQVQGLEI